MSLLLETVQVRDGRITAAEYHNERFNRSRRSLFGITAPADIRDIVKIPGEYLSGTVKCRIFYNRDIRGVEFQNYFPKIIGSLKLVACDDIDYGYKYADRSLLNSLMARRGDCDDILIVRNGLITDTSFTNVVFFRNGTGYTPEIPLLPGTKRAALLKSGAVKTAVIRPDDLPLYEEIHLVNAFLDQGDCVVPAGCIAGL